MKNFISIIYLLIVVSGSLSAQEERGITGANNWLNNWTEFMPSRVNYGEKVQILTGNISEDTILYKKHTYLLLGNVFVINNAILSIEPGTVIMGDFKTKATLTITLGAAIIAEGTSSDPIVFTSNNTRKKAGDWGGVIILGDGYTNKLGKSSVTSLYANIKPSNYKYTNFGGENVKKNSGFISYVRIEFAGGASNNSGFSNGLLLAGVGAKTTINNVMVSYSAGNSFGVIGGEINMNQMVSNKSKGNDYDFKYGAVCNINNSLAVRSPYISSIGSKCMAVSSYTNTNELDVTKKGTVVVAKNMTLLTDSEDLDYDIKAGLIKESIFIGKDTYFSLESSVVSGFNNAVVIDENIKINATNLSKIKLRNICFNNCSGNIFSNLNKGNTDLEIRYKKPIFFNDYSKINHSELFIDLSSNKKVDYRLRTHNMIAMNNVSEPAKN
ncbi:hypothetical protein Q4566_15320 [Tamlana sp. 2_MG-2023]|uniref:hypothetical protein n=1 Tax=unclassified Tamlana TaxID=2614803 RepID=UPI0026E1C7A0|nr:MULTISPECIES: hypothetical protein [unclassified Tamlana]MDO6761579.1 hypothetical protein [Tamlana sp. 2_MG-2023]MDO6792291.1 hypothetical protein [Tamlana sp. 1_MG-2023]